MKIGMMIPLAEITPDNVINDGIVWRQLREKLVKEMGGKYSSALGIDLASRESGEIFEWFLAALLLGARIDENIALNTYKEFEKAGVLSPEAILEAGRQGLVDILDRGGYVRYDFKTATKLLEMARALIEKYQGDLNRLHFFAEDGRNLDIKLQSLGKGIGPVTVNIFLRELRGIWEKAEPPLPIPVLLSAKHLGLIRATDTPVALEELRALLEADEQTGVSFSDIEAALLRLGKKYCGKERCSLCSLREECISANG